MSLPLMTLVQTVCIVRDDDFVDWDSDLVSDCGFVAEEDGPHAEQSLLAGGCVTNLKLE